MKLISHLFLLSLILCSYEYKYPSRPPYVVVSDQEDPEVKKGFCVVEGHVYDPNGLPVIGATISKTDHSLQRTTDSSGFYRIRLKEKDSSLYMFHENYGEIVVKNYDFKSKHRVVIDFYPGKQQPENQTVKKPVIYLYSDEEIQVQVSVDHAGLTFTYPEMHDAWVVKTQTNGMMLDSVSSKLVPYLFWEAQTTGLHFYEEENYVPGFLIATDTVTSFLEKNLIDLGLNDRERTDFITYWAPSIQKSPYAFIQFRLDEDYAREIAEINLSPKPESSRRVFMYFTPLQECHFASHAPQHITPFVRKGLTLVEWGGAEINPLKEF